MSHMAGEGLSVIVSVQFFIVGCGMQPHVSSHPSLYFFFLFSAMYSRFKQAVGPGIL